MEIGKPFFTLGSVLALVLAGWSLISEESLAQPGRPPKDSGKKGLELRTLPSAKGNSVVGNLPGGFPNASANGLLLPIPAQGGGFPISSTPNAGYPLRVLPSSNPGAAINQLFNSNGNWNNNYGPWNNNLNNSPLYANPYQSNPFLTNPFMNNPFWAPGQVVGMSPWQFANPFMPFNQFQNPWQMNNMFMPMQNPFQWNMNPLFNQAMPGQNPFASPFANPFMFQNPGFGFMNNNLGFANMPVGFGNFGGLNNPFLMPPFGAGLNNNPGLPGLR